MKGIRTPADVTDVGLGFVAHGFFLYLTWR